MGRDRKDSMNGKCGGCSGMKEGGKWMQKTEKHKGALHEALGIKQDKKIPAKRLDKATHSKNPKIKKEVVLAETFRKYRPGNR